MIYVPFYCHFPFPTLLDEFLGSTLVALLSFPTLLCRFDIDVLLIVTAYDVPNHE